MLAQRVDSIAQYSGRSFWFTLKSLYSHQSFTIKPQYKTIASLISVTKTKLNHTERSLSRVQEGQILNSQSGSQLPLVFLTTKIPIPQPENYQGDNRPWGYYDPWRKLPHLEELTEKIGSSTKVWQVGFTLYQLLWCIYDVYYSLSYDFVEVAYNNLHSDMRTTLQSIHRFCTHGFSVAF